MNNKLNKKIRSAGPSITEAEINLVSEAIRDGWHEKMSFYIDMFIDEFSAYTKHKYCLPTAHCTDAIHLAVLALGVGPGDEVIVPDLTWVASAAPIVYVGAKPVFADIDPISLCVTADTIKQKITSKTKAVIVVDLLGNMPEWDEILDLCQNHKISVIEDAAEGIGATYKGHLAGTFGEISLFSFNATKLIMSGQGGMFCTNDKNLYEKAKLYSHHGIDKNSTGKYYWSCILGYNYNWTNIQAALALAQLRRIDELISYKKWLFSQYREKLEDHKGIRLSQTKENVDPTYWITTVIVDSSYGLTKEEICELFTVYDIDIRPLFYPISSMPPFSDYVDANIMHELNPNAYNLSKYGICLPNGNDLSLEEIELICSSFREILKTSTKNINFENSNICH